ncbi:MAG: alpha/beta hydrolase [Spirochaetales bacterium]|nr:alpha/beta hydrolase [Spirochaetales bacterium]
MNRLLLLLPFLALLSCGGEGVYRPGELARAFSAGIPEQNGTGPDYWRMDENTELYHFSQGEGRNVLMIHGGPGAPFPGPWPGLERLEGYRFHYYHQRGCGRSTVPFSDFPRAPFPKNAARLEDRLGLSRQLEDIERIRRLLGEEKLIIIGHSFGGFLAVLYALEFPDRVERMILVEPADMLAMPPPHGGMNQIEAALPPVLAQEYKKFTREYFNYGKFFKRTEEELAYLNGRYGDFYFAALEIRSPGSTAALEGTASSVSGGFSGHAPFFSLGRSYDYREMLRSIGCPVLVIHGAKDLYGPEATREYAELLPKGVYTEMAGSSHFPFMEEPEAFRSVVEDFL